MILCQRLNTGSVAKLVVVGSEFQTLTTLSAKNWLHTPLLSVRLAKFIQRVEFRSQLSSFLSTPWTGKFSHTLTR